MTKHLLEVVINWLDDFPSENNISKTKCPTMIVQGRKPDFSKRNIISVHMCWCILSLQTPINQGAYQ